mmetsp:Transcript_1928/g.6346  ORF Transcript_1928/g.6346 Transcript_1928/m.6346 type:complete len:236 (+) Transcript_1928:182-889(+)
MPRGCAARGRLGIPGAGQHQGARAGERPAGGGEARQGVPRRRAADVRVYGATVCGRPAPAAGPWRPERGRDRAVRAAGLREDRSGAALPACADRHRHLAAAGRRRRARGRYQRDQPRVDRRGHRDGGGRLRVLRRPRGRRLPRRSQRAGGRRLPGGCRRAAAALGRSLSRAARGADPAGEPGRGAAHGGAGVQASARGASGHGRGARTGAAPLTRQLLHLKTSRGPSPEKPLLPS